MGLWIHLLRRKIRLTPIKAPCLIGACKLTHPAADTPVVIDQHHAIGITEGCPYRAGLDARWLFTLLALDGHIKIILIGHHLIIRVIALSMLSGKPADGSISIAANLNAVITKLAGFRITLIQFVFRKREIPFRDFHYLYPLNDRVGARLIVLLHTGMHTTSTAYALGDIEGIAE